MSSPSPSTPVIQLRLVVEAEDFNEALAFYRDALGLTEQAAFQGDNDARVVILDAGREAAEEVKRGQDPAVHGRPRKEVAHDQHAHRGQPIALVRASSVRSPVVESSR